MRILGQVSRSHKYTPSPRSSVSSTTTSASTRSTRRASADRLLTCDINIDIARIRCKLVDSFFERLPLEMLVHLLLFCTVPSIMCLEAASKDIKSRIEQSNLYEQYSKRSKHMLVRHLNDYLHASNNVPGCPGMYWDSSLNTTRARKFPLVLHHNMNLMISDLKEQIREGCAKVKDSYDKTVLERWEIGYRSCSQRSYKLARELLFLELLRLRLHSLQSNCIFPKAALTIADPEDSPNILNCHVMTYSFLSAQDRGNIIKVIKCLKNRNFGPAGARIRNSLFSISPALYRCYFHVHHTQRSNTVLNMICRPDIMSSYPLPDGRFIHTGEGAPQYPPHLVNAALNIVDIESSDDEGGDDFFPHGPDYNGPHHHDIVFQNLPWAEIDE